MPGVAIVTDSACDLTEALERQAGISVVPLTIRFGTDELVDRHEMTPSQFWERCRGMTELPETAAPPPGAFRDAFEAAADRGSEAVLCLTLSAGVSATYQSALTAAQAFGRIPVEVVDTRSLTMGQGLVALVAAEAAAGGADLARLREVTADAIARTRVFGVVDTLDHLQRGGRIGGARALLGSILSIKPVVEVREGVVAEESKQRTRARSLDYLAEKVRADAPLERLAVANGAAADIDQFLERLTGIAVRRPLLVVELGPVVGTHAGPGTIGVCYQVTGS